MYRKFRELWIRVFELWEQTDRHTDTLIAILRTPTGDKVIYTFIYFQIKHYPCFILRLICIVQQAHLLVLLQYCYQDLTTGLETLTPRSTDQGQKFTLNTFGKNNK